MRPAKPRCFWRAAAARSSQHKQAPPNQQRCAHRRNPGRRAAGWWPCAGEQPRGHESRRRGLQRVAWGGWVPSHCLQCPQTAAGPMAVAHWRSPRGRRPNVRGLMRCGGGQAATHMQQCRRRRGPGAVHSQASPYRSLFVTRMPPVGHQAEKPPAAAPRVTSLGMVHTAGRCGRARARVARECGRGAPLPAGRKARRARGATEQTGGRAGSQGERTRLAGAAMAIDGGRHHSAGASGTGGRPGSTRPRARWRTRRERHKRCRRLEAARALRVTPQQVRPQANALSDWHRPLACSMSASPSPPLVPQFMQTGPPHARPRRGSPYGP
jgi:hypothetical protein